MCQLVGFVQDERERAAGREEGARTCRREALHVDEQSRAKLTWTVASASG
jgi:hypothetical protein